MLKKIVVLLIVGSTLLIACESQGNNSRSTTAVTPETENFTRVVPDHEDRKIVSFAVNESEIRTYATLIELFESENPNIKVHLVPLTKIFDDAANGDGIGSQTLALAQAVDVFPSTYAFGTHWKQLTQDLTPFIANTPQFDQGDFYLDSLYEQDGSIRVLPISLSFSLIYYNKQIFDAAGLAYPQSGWLWSDFRAAAQALTYHEGNDVFQWGLVNAFPAPFSFVGSQLANGLVDYNSNPPRPRFEEPDVIEAMRLYTGLYLIDQVAPDFTGPEAAERQQELIQLGRAAMWPDSFDSFQAYEQVLNVGVAPYPANQANPNSTMVIVNGLVMSAEARNPEAAWMWMDFLARQPLANTLPARTSVAEASGYWQDIDAELEEVMRQALSNSFVFQPGVTNFVFTTAVADILNGDKSVEDALLDAQAEGEHLLSIDIGEPEFTVEHQNMDENDNSSAITFITDNNLEPYYILAEQFEAETGIGVEVRSRYSYSTNDRLTFREMAQSSDCFHAGPEMQDAANLDVILNLTPFVEADPTFDLADFYTSLVEQFTYQGQLWALPADFEPILIEYNRDLFDAAHVPYPVSTWTMDDFLETAVALTADEGETKQYGFVPDAVEFNIMRQMLAQFGVRLVDNRIDPPTVHLTEPTVIEAVRWYTNLSNAHGVKPVFLIDPLSALSEGGDPGIYFEERTRLISNNQAAMWTRFGVSSGGYSLNDSTNLPHVGVVPLPSVPDVPIGSIVNVTGYYISINTQNREPCWEWINYLTQFVESAVGMPGRHSIAESEDYYQRVGEAVALAQQVSVEHAEISPFVTDDEWLDYSSLWLARAVSKITLDEVPVEEALEVAQQTFDAYRACIIDKNAFTNYEEQSQCALEVDPSLAVILDNANR